eukprot:IDg10917t1
MVGTEAEIITVAEIGRWNHGPIDEKWVVIQSVSKSENANFQTSQRRWALKSAEAILKKAHANLDTWKELLKKQSPRSRNTHSRALAKRTRPEQWLALTLTAFSCNFECQAIQRSSGQMEHVLVDLLASVRKTVDTGDKDGQIHIFASSAHSGCKISVLYKRPTCNSSVRSVAVVLQLNKYECGTRHRVGCVRFWIDSPVSIEEKLYMHDIKRICSCSEAIVSSTCAHEHKKALLVDDRTKGIAKVWLSIPYSAAGGDCIEMFVPVWENRREGRAKDDISRRLRCLHCRRAPGNRVLCEHERSVLVVAKPPKQYTKEDVADKELNQNNTNEFESEELAEDEENSNAIEVEMHNQIFESKRMRSLLRCASDDAALKNMFVSISERKRILMISGHHFSINGHGVLHPFDGADAGLFRVSRRITYARDLLDFWLYETAAIGATFREAYDATMQFSRTSSELHPHAMSALDCNRRCASDAFAIFCVQSLCRKRRITRGSSHATFSSASFLNSNATRSPFCRQATALMNSFLTSVHVRALLNTLLRAASIAGDGSFFTVSLPKRVARHKRANGSQLYSMSASAGIREQESRDVSIGNISHKIRTVSLRTVAIDFARTFGATSIPGAVLLSEEYLRQAVSISKKLQLFADCKHNKLRTCTVSLSPCINCSIGLKEACRAAFSVLPTASALGIALVGTKLQDETVSLRLMASAAESVLEESVHVREKFSTHFSWNQSASSAFYTKTYMQSPSSNGHSNQTHNKFKGRRIPVAESDVGLSGEIFPGRPVLRPHVRLSNPTSKATDEED